MATVARIDPIKYDLAGLGLSKVEVADLVQHAQESVVADGQLTLREAVQKYRKAVFWAMFLSTSLIMEGYDLVILCYQEPHLDASANARADWFFLWTRTVPTSLRNA